MNEEFRDLVARIEVEAKQASGDSLWIGIPRARWEELVRLAGYRLGVCEVCGHSEHDSPYYGPECGWRTCTCYISPCPDCGQDTWRDLSALGWNEGGTFSNVMSLSVCYVCERVFEHWPMALAG